MLSKIKTLLGIEDSSKDALLQVLIDQATEQILAYTHNPNCLCKLTGTIVDMCVIMYNRLKTEGLAGESYSGVSFTYMQDYPETIQRAIRTHRKIRTC